MRKCSFPPHPACGHLTLEGKLSALALTDEVDAASPLCKFFSPILCAAAS